MLKSCIEKAAIDLNFPLKIQERQITKIQDLLFVLEEKSIINSWNIFL